jgi:hypothetical protein
MPALHQPALLAQALNRRPTCTTSGNQASAATCPRGPWPNSTRPAIWRHRRDRQRRVDTATPPVRHRQPRTLLTARPRRPLLEVRGNTNGKDGVAGSILAGGSPATLQVRPGLVPGLSHAQEPATAVCQRFDSPIRRLCFRCSPAAGATPRRLRRSWAIRPSLDPRGVLGHGLASGAREQANSSCLGQRLGPLDGCHSCCSWVRPDRHFAGRRQHAPSSAFLRCPESGTSAMHPAGVCRNAPRTAMTGAFTVRLARGVRRFLDQRSAAAPRLP